ncbi:MAG: HAD family hydrolase [Calditrichaeota bacterium]|nr:MAG: HAD family hydrolase [Calditrichota bacterium]MBL1206172.1 HAD family hydrolase [Calditrichota bacterium]NOG45997.1 HAD-IA family hydrolase [Calditrichota bacterium]
MTEKLKIELIIFDLDGTLAETRQDIADAANYMLAQLKLPTLPEATITSYVGNGIKKLIERCLPGSSESLREQGFNFFVEFYANHLADNTYLYPGVLNILKELRQLKMAVLSNKAQRFTEEIIHKLDIENYFKIVMGSNPHFPKKPAPDSINHIIETLDCSKQKTIIIGDTKNDIIAGKAANIHTCAVTYGFRSKEKLLKYNPDFMIDSIVELNDILVPSF